MVQMVHSVAIRIKEHSRHLRLAQTEKSAFALHCWQKGHQANFKDTKIIYRSGNWEKESDKGIVGNCPLRLADEFRRGGTPQHSMASST